MFNYSIYVIIIVSHETAHWEENYIMKLKQILWQKRHLPKIELERIYREGYTYYREYINDQNPELEQRKKEYFEWTLQGLNQYEREEEKVQYPFNIGFICSHCPGYVKMMQMLYRIQQQIEFQKLLNELDKD